MKVQAGKLYRIVVHKGLANRWLEEHGSIWLATKDEHFDETTVARKPGWVADFKSVSSGYEFQISRYEPWSLVLEEADGGDT